MPTPYDQQDVVISSGRRGKGEAGAFVGFDTSPSYQWAVVRHRGQTSSKEWSSTHEIIIEDSKRRPLGRIWWQSTITAGIGAWISQAGQKAAVMDAETPGKEPDGITDVTLEITGLAEVSVKLRAEDRGGTPIQLSVTDEIQRGNGGEWTGIMTLPGPDGTFSGVMRIALYSYPVLTFSKRV